MDDIELLEFAAKACGYKYSFGYSNDESLAIRYGMTKALWVEDLDEDSDDHTFYWNPLEDDAQAFKLFVKLGMNVSIYGDCANVFLFSPNGWYSKQSELYNKYNDDRYAATRRAIVRTAAEIGRRM